MHPSHDPAQQEIEALVTDEERRARQDPTVPDEVKSEIMERLARYRASDLEQLASDDGP